MRAHAITTRSAFILVLAVVITAVWAAPALGNAPEPASGTGQSSSALYVALGDSVAAARWHRAATWTACSPTTNRRSG